MWTWKISSQMNDLRAGDLDNDGRDEAVVVVWNTDSLFGIDDDGTGMWSFQVTDTSFQQPGGFVGDVWDICLADLDGDGYLEVVVGTDEGWLGALNGSDGSLLDSAEPQNGDGRLEVSTAELDGTAGDEILACDRWDTRDAFGYELTGGGALNELWNRDVRTWINAQTGWNNFDPIDIVGADVDDDGHDEPIVFTETHGTGFGGANPRTFILQLDESTGGVDDYYTYLNDVDGSEMRDVAVGDINTTAGEEFVIAASNYAVAFDVVTGNLCSFWSRGLTDPVRAVDIGNLDQDGALEVVFAGDNGKITAVDGADGATVWSRFYIDGTQAQEDGLEVFDAEGDGDEEVAVAEEGSAVIVLDTTGAELWRVDCAYQDDLLSADLDGDGTEELLSLGPGANTVSAYDGIWERPVLGIASPADGAMVEGVIGVTTTSAVEPDTIDEVRLFVDGEHAQTTSIPMYQFSLDTTALADGWHTLSLMTYDAVGNTNDTPGVNILVDNDDPSGAITSPAQGEVLGGPVTITAEASDTGSGVAAVDFRVDGTAEYTDDTPPYQFAWDTGTFADGTHALSIGVKDVMGHNSTAQLGVVVDNLPPALTDITLADGDVLSGDIPVSLNATDAGTDTAWVEFSVDTELRAKDTGAPFCWDWDTTGERAGNHLVSIKAQDRSGNFATASFTVTIDNTNPLVTILEPSAGSIVKGEIPLTVDIAEDQLLTGVEYTLTGLDDNVLGGALAEEPVDGLYSAVIDTTGVANGDYALTVTAHRVAGDPVTAGTGVTVDNTVAISQPSDGALLRGAVEVIAITNGDEAIDGVTISVGGKTAGVMYALGGDAYVYMLDTTALDDGSHVISVDADGQFGLVGTDTADVIVDNSYPVIDILSPHQGDHLAGTFTVEADITDTPEGNLTREYSVDGGVWVGIETPADTTLLNDGQHSISIRAVDAIGHSTTTRVDFISDNTAPVVALVGSGEVPATDRGFRLEVAVDEGFSLSSVTADIADAGLTALPLTLDPSTGMHVLEVDSWESPGGTSEAALTAVDRAGNVGRCIATLVHDSTAPTARIISHGDGDVVSGEFTLEALANDDLRITSVSASAGGATLGQMTLDGASGLYYLTVDSAALGGGGSSAVKVTARDFSGNTAEAIVNLTVDNAAPSVQFLHDGTQAEKVVFKVRVTDPYSPVSAVLFRVEGGDWEEMAVTDGGDYAYSWKTTTSEDNGEYAFEVRVTDAQGNEETYTGEITVDNPKDHTAVILGTLAVVLIIVFVLLFMVMRKKKKAKEAEWEGDEEKEDAKEGGDTDAPAEEAPQAEKEAEAPPAEAPPAAAPPVEGEPMAAPAAPPKGDAPAAAAAPPAEAPAAAEAAAVAEAPTAPAEGEVAAAAAVPASDVPAAPETPAATVAAEVPLTPDAPVEPGAPATQSTALAVPAQQAVVRQ